MKGILSVILIYLLSVIGTAVGKYLLYLYKNKRGTSAPKIYYVETAPIKQRKKPKRRKDEIAIKGAVIEKEDFNAF